MASTPTVREIHSLDNPLIKEIRRARDRGEPLSRGEFAGTLALDSPHLVEEAVKSGLVVEALLFDAGVNAGVRETVERLPVGATRYKVSPAVYKKVASTESPQGLLALARPRQWVAHELFAPSPTLVVILAGIQDPGNAGTLLRTAEAFGATGVMLLRGSVHETNPKLLRAAAGSTFRVPHLGGIQLDQALAMCATQKTAIYALDPRAKTPLDRVDLRRPVALAVGAEGTGLPPGLVDNAQPVAIPRVRRVESLNAAVAGALALYEAARQRSSLG